MKGCVIVSVNFEGFEKEIKFLSEKFPNKSDSIEDVINDATTIYLNLRRNKTQSSFDEIEKNWIKRCAIELINNERYIGVKNYSENGFAIQKFDTDLSPSLIREVVPKVVKLL